jgi:farnesyl-diphosphate farnesyltransferase
MPALMDLLRFDEVIAMVRVKTQFANQKVALREDQADLKFCYDILNHVSRSFAAVIIQLHDELRDAVCLFYLVLRGLDTVEDDMSVPVPKKKEILPTFHKTLEQKDWHIDGIGKGKERELLEQFWRVALECQKLKPAYMEVIQDICHKMALGMCHFLENDVQTKADYDLYCHYVAGLVGHGLTRLFAHSGLESPSLAKDLTTSNNMGLFLQKVNIIRDYYEDIVEDPPRIFWPKEIWGNFGESMHDFKPKENQQKALECLNAMVADALQLIPDCVDYMSALHEKSVVLFCAIPQVMAIATLVELYDNPAVFNDKVKIRKGVACKIILNSGNLQSVLMQFKGHCDALAAKLRPEDPSYDKIRQALSIANKRFAEAAKENNFALEPSFARSFLTKYPALGGQMLYKVVDSVGGLFRSQ